MWHALYVTPSACKAINVWAILNVVVIGNGFKLDNYAKYD
jgi:hypothetical protein